MFLVVIVLIIVIVGSSFISSISALFNGEYSEETFQTYANECYANEFGQNPDTYEDNILLIFLVNDNCDDFYSIAWVGDNLRSEVSGLFGNESTAYGNAVYQNVNTEYYEYSLSSSLAGVMEQMEDEVSSLGLDSPFRSESSGDKTASHFVNKSNLSMTNATVESALTAFTDTTGIPVAIVVDYMDNATAVTISFESAYWLIGLVAFAGLLIWLFVRKSKNNDSYETEE